MIYLSGSSRFRDFLCLLPPDAGRLRMTRRLAAVITVRFHRKFPQWRRTYEGIIIRMQILFNLIVMRLRQNFLQAGDGESTVSAYVVSRGLAVKLFRVFVYMVTAGCGTRYVDWSLAFGKSKPPRRRAQVAAAKRELIGCNIGQSGRFYYGQLVLVLLGARKDHGDTIDVKRKVLGPLQKTDTPYPRVGHSVVLFDVTRRCRISTVTRTKGTLYVRPEDIPQCCICTSRMPGGILRPCGHRCLCQPCWKQLLKTASPTLLRSEGPTCPICRSKIVRFQID